MVGEKDRIKGTIVLLSYLWFKALKNILYTNVFQRQYNEQFNNSLKTLLYS